MHVQFPRRIQLGFRPWYGLTLRQLGYLVVASVVAGVVVLFGPVEGNGFLIRVLIALAIISVGVALAFFRKDGLTAEQWVITQIKFQLQPHKRVWTRGGDASAKDQIAEVFIDEEPGESAILGATSEGELADLHLLRPSAQATSLSSAVVVFVDMAMLFSLFSLVVYLSRGGLGEIQAWLAMQTAR
jgi:hypothetical protein